MRVVCPISVGELIDKISILLVKREKIRDREKLLDCNKELIILTSLVTGEMGSEIEDLKRVNSELFSVLEEQHLLLKGDLDDPVTRDRYCLRAKKVYELNCERYRLKAALNEKYESDIKERKSY